MTMASAVVLLLSLAGLSAGKQITLSPPLAPLTPPPPASTVAPPVTFVSPGIVFSFVVPGTTSLTTASQSALGDLVAAGFSGPGFTSTSTITGASPFNGTSTIVNGFTVAKWSSLPTASAISVATSLRNSYLTTLTSNSSSVFGASFPGIAPNCACNGVSSVSTLPTSDFTYSTNVTTPGPVQCGSRLVSSGATSVGIDDGSVVPGNRGKFCSTPAVTGGVVGVPGNAPCVSYGVVASSDGTTTAISPTTTVSTTTSGIVTTAITLTSAGTGYTSTPTVTVDAPSQKAATVTITLSSGVPTGAIDSTTNGPYPSGVPLRVASLTYPTGTTCVGASGTGGAGSVTISGTVYTGNQYTLADWQDTTVNTNGVFGKSTIAVTSTALATFTVPSGLRCSGIPAITFEKSFIPIVQPVVTASLSTTTPGALAATLTVVNGGSGYVTGSTPSITISSPVGGDQLGKLCSQTPISLPSATAVNAQWTTAISSTGSCRPIARDSFGGTVCSVPAVSGGIYMPVNTYTCNVVSSYIPQPGSSTTNQCAIVPQSFTSTASGSAPSPAPSPPTSGPSPATPPSPPTTTTYRGRFQIASVACKGKFIAASGNCGDRSVLLRTVAQSKGSRTFWAIDGTAAVATGVTSVVRIGSCNGKANLASAQSTPTPVVGGPSWKVKLTPVDATKPNIVTIEATDKTYKGKLLQVGDKCDDQKGFVWAAKSSSTGQQWELTALSNVN